MQKSLLFIFSLCAFLFAGCDSDLDPDSLIGMSKNEVIRSAFEKCNSDANGELNIGTWEVEENGKRSYRNHYYKSPDAALKNSSLMACDIWEIGKKYKFSFSILKKEECFEALFKDGKAFKVEKRHWNKT